jgi:hypothetical protein
MGRAFGAWVGGTGGGVFHPCLKRVGRGGHPPALPMMMRLVMNGLPNGSLVIDGLHSQSHIRGSVFPVFGAWSRLAGKFHVKNSIGNVDLGRVPVAVVGFSRQ